MYRKGVSALICNANKEFLLVNLTGFEERYFAVPGGGIDPGESHEQAAYREIMEELGIGKESLVLVGKSETPVITIFKTPKKESLGSERYFLGFQFIGNESEIVLKPDEVRSYVWVPYSELGSRLLFDDQLRDTEKKIREIFGSEDKI